MFRFAPCRLVRKIKHYCKASRTDLHGKPYLTFAYLTLVNDEQKTFRNHWIRRAACFNRGADSISIGFFCCRVCRWHTHWTVFHRSSCVSLLSFHTNRHAQKIYTILSLLYRSQWQDIDALISSNWHTDCCWITGSGRDACWVTDGDTGEIGVICSCFVHQCRPTNYWKGGLYAWKRTSNCHTTSRQHFTVGAAMCRSEAYLKQTRSLFEERFDRTKRRVLNALRSAYWVIGIGDRGSWNFSVFKKMRAESRRHWTTKCSQKWKRKDVTKLCGTKRTSLTFTYG